MSTNLYLLIEPPRLQGAISQLEQQKLVVAVVAQLMAISRISLDVVQDLLAVVVVLVEPAHHLIGRHQVGGAEGFPQSRLEDRCQMLHLEPL